MRLPDRKDCLGMGTTATGVSGSGGKTAGGEVGRDVGIEMACAWAVDALERLVAAAAVEAGRPTWIPIFGIAVASSLFG